MGSRSDRHLERPLCGSHTPYTKDSGSPPPPRDNPAPDIRTYFRSGTNSPVSESEGLGLRRVRFAYTITLI